ncbi:MAG: SDR family oxidoreductase, partial [Clostridia bacterium]|nr:SDR family oxidoreductase [Clostridia bacterium]
MQHTVSILLTGGTGFLGTELAARLIQHADAEIRVLVRAADAEAALHRLKAAWQHDRDLYASIGRQILPVCGDFTKQDLGLKPDDCDWFVQHITHVVHAGAEIGFQKGRSEIELANVDGTGNVLAFAAKLQGLKRFVHLSTAYVAGQRSGLIPEDGSVGTSFSSLYEKSKADAEALVRASGLPFVICRPGMIVGDSRTGWVRNFNTIYYVLKQLLQGRMKVLPIRADTALNLVPVDWVADAVAKVLYAEGVDGQTFHLTCPKEAAPKAGELVEHVRSFAKEQLSLDLARPVFLPLPFLKKAGLAYNRKEEDRKKSSLTNLLTLLPYFFSEQTFERSRTDAVCGAYTLKWQDYMNRLLAFACRKNFMRQTGQTVFEQACVRRGSSRYPISYYDVGEGGIQKVSGPEINARIDQALSAMWAWGIRKGDRVALTGINTSDYLVIEQAIGLIGAVSVPIYYTSPAQETGVLLEKSGAGWFFVGDKRMMTQLDALTTKARIVTFSVVRDQCPKGGMTWADFLSKAGEKVTPVGPDPEDLATIRYTSGTTGEPKGVTFNFSQLAWMGEVLTNLVGWEDRNRPMRYLSFLPLSHVVEGILASY